MSALVSSVKGDTEWDQCWRGKVLVMMPNCSSKMFSQWMGEYPVIRCDHYEIQMERRKAVWHINSLKRFIARDKRVGGVLIAQEYDEEDAQYPTCLEMKEEAKRFNIGGHLDGTQKRKLLEILESFPDVFSDVPGRTDLVQCQIKLRIPLHAKLRRIKYRSR